MLRNSVSMEVKSQRLGAVVGTAGVVVVTAAGADVGCSLSDRRELILGVIAVCVVATMLGLAVNAVVAGAIFKVMSPVSPL